MKLVDLAKVFWSIMFICLLAGCTEKDMYDPNNKNQLPNPDNYFGFEMRDDVNLSVNYGVEGTQTLIEIYGENPLASKDNQRVKKEGVEALFKIYTDENGKFEGKMNIPTAVKNVYLYTETWGLPGCLELEVKDGVVSYDSHQVRSNTSAMKAKTRSIQFQGNVPYLIDANRNLYSLCKWASYGDIVKNWDFSPVNEDYISYTGNVGKETVNVFMKRLKSILYKGSVTDNSQYVKGPETTNIYTREKAALKVVFLNKDASYENTFGYYYYKGKEHANVDVNKLKKYIIFPRVTQASGIDGDVLYPGYTAQLKFFGEYGDEKPLEEFPEGYTIGWFIYSDGYRYDYDSTPGYIAETGTWINGNKGGGVVTLITSNDKKKSYINVLDEQSGKLILGVEDGVNQSYVDLLFYVDATPSSAVENPDRPSIDDPDKPVEKPDDVEFRTGTLAFEDIWPSGGDYDMNDVIVEYKREVYFNTKNQVTKIVDMFTPVHDGAQFLNAFAYQIANGQMGKVSLPAGSVLESETSSVIVFPNAKTAKGNIYQIVREFDANSRFNKKDIELYNPYIIANYVEGQSGRTEVHLPKYKATSLADLTLIGSKNDAYYVRKDGAYPFAIDLPIWNFKAVTEMKSIDEEYPTFKAWADSFGSTNQDWYLNYNKK